MSGAAWRKIVTSEPYRRLKEREASLKRAFTDDDFRKFVLSPDLARRAPDLRKTLAAWEKGDFVAAARLVLPYLPDDAVIHAKVYLLMKPQRNSFVFDVAKDPTIFLFLDPDRTEGPWYTVGYRMAVVIERDEGRAKADCLHV